ncbi:MAG TPA: response regulator [Chthoniobacter sp.]|jgi:CheY-like chemotaxis protein
MNALRILHVDDNSALTTIFRIVLENSGRYVVREETCGEQALATAQEFQPDLILLDKGLGAISGEEVAAQLHSDPRLRMVPIAFTTGRVTREEAAEAEVPTLPKPVSPSELLDFVDDLLNFNAVCVG